MTDTDDKEINPLDLVNGVVRSVNNLPIVSRLEMVANILQDNGGERHSTPQNEMMIVAYEILTQVTEVIRRHPAAADLRALNLKPGG